MKTRYENNSLRRYLLGNLAEAETELLDELSFTDDEFVARLQTVEDDLIAAYLHGALLRPEHGLFQANYMATPRRREKVQFAQTLHTFANQHAQAGQTMQVAAPDNEVQTPQPVRQPDSWWRNLFTIPNLTRQWGLAAAALLLLAGGWLGWETMRQRGQIDMTAHAVLEQQMPDGQPPPTPPSPEQFQPQAKAQPPVRTIAPFQIELLPQTRTGGESKPLSIPAKTAYVILKLKMEEDDFQAYQVELLTQADDQRRWKSGKLKARIKGAAKVLEVRLRAHLLPADRYVVMLRGINASGEVADIRKYAFNIRKP